MMTTRAAAVLLLLLIIGRGSFAQDDKIVCQGTSNKLALLEHLDAHYHNLQNAYNNCEIVLENLEITYVPSNEDMSFLKSIREVGGYVLIALNHVRSIPLDNLQLIRGNTLHESFALTVVLNYEASDGLEELGLRNLGEILLGGVRIEKNPYLCNMNTVKWEDIVNITNPKNKLIIDQRSPKKCPKCHSSCPHGSCWGAGPENCQNYTKLICAQQCSGRCRGRMPNDCCHTQCASGCTGPRESDCLVCRLVHDGNMCKQTCPPLQLYEHTTYQMVVNPDGKYSFGSTCVTKCPHNFVVTDRGSCDRSCIGNTFEVEENGVRKCKQCDGPCSKVCHGLGTSDLRGTTAIHSNNIERFSNCTTIQGNVAFFPLSFNGDGFEEIPPLDPTKLDYFKTVKEITGYLSIQDWPENKTYIDSFENLEIIRGRTKSMGFALAVVNVKVQYLGFRSLREISDGNAVIKNDNQICYMDTINWTSVFKTKTQKSKVEMNKSPEECLAENKVCDPLCSDNGCWGPGPFHCLSCRYFQRARECVKACNILKGEPREFVKNESCFQCHAECKVENATMACTGLGSENCVRCAHYKDGPHCMKTCPAGIMGENNLLIWKYHDENNVCQLCHANCTHGCTGPGLEGCPDLRCGTVHFDERRIANNRLKPAWMTMKKSAKIDMDEIMERVKKRQEQYKKYYDQHKHVKESKIEVGDWVRVREPKRILKGESKFRVPQKIIKPCKKSVVLEGADKWSCDDIILARKNGEENGNTISEASRKTMEEREIVKKPIDGKSHGTPCRNVDCFSRPRRVILNHREDFIYY